MVELADSRILAASRNDRPDVQEQFGGKTALSNTSDLGKTWSFAAMEFPAISSVQRQVLIRLHEGPLLFCSFTDQGANRKTRKRPPVQSRRWQRIHRLRPFCRAFL
jgi:formylglycine-generating enzyme